MKYWPAIALGLLLPYCGAAQTQSEMNETAHKWYTDTDKALNNTYRKVLVMYKADTVFIRNFKAAQRIWVQFRDAEMMAKYPDEPGEIQGSIMPLCWYEYKRDLTEERTKKIKEWLTGAPEGNPCEGSVIVK